MFRTTEVSHAFRSWSRTALAASKPWALEACASVLPAGVLVVHGLKGIKVDPLDRIGQVSGLASLNLVFSLLFFVALAALFVASRAKDPATFPRTTRLACAALAGLIGGLIGGGLAVALQGTRFGLGANMGDAGQLQTWAAEIAAGKGMPSNYPPLFVHILEIASRLSGRPIPYVWKHAEIYGSTLLLPAAYFAWRSFFSPLWALTIGVTAAIPIVYLCKPYEPMALILIVPLFASLLRSLERWTPPSAWERRAISTGAAYGAGFGVLFLTYSGWFLWSAPGAVLALGHTIWRRASERRRNLVLLGCAAIAFVLVSGRHLVGILSAAGDMKDKFFYFDVFTDPAYFVMWRGGFAGSALAHWPPSGELGGVGLYTILLAAGLGVAIALGRGHPLVVTTALFAAGAWLLRFRLASRMFALQAVQLYPRTSAEILHCSLLLTLFAGHCLLGRNGSSDIAAAAMGSHLSRGHQKVLGAFAGLGLLFLSAGSSIVDQHMPADDGGPGGLAYWAHSTPNLTNQCSRFARLARKGREWTCQPLTRTPAGKDPRKGSAR